MRLSIAVESVRKAVACRAGRAEVALPFESVGQIVEYPVHPLPLCRPYIAGIGVHEERPLISVTLSRSPQPALAGGARIAKGVLLHADGLEIDWALEVDALGTFIDVTVQPTQPAPGLDLPVWIGQAIASDGVSRAWLDVPAMLRALSEVAA